MQYLLQSKRLTIGAVDGVAGFRRLDEADEAQESFGEFVIASSDSPVRSLLVEEKRLWVKKQVLNSVKPRSQELQEFGRKGLQIDPQYKGSGIPSPLTLALGFLSFRVLFQKSRDSSTIPSLDAGF